MYKHILLPTDGTERARLGVDHGLALARSESSKVTAIFVSQPYPLQTPIPADFWINDQKQAAEKALEVVRGAAQRAGVEISVLQTSGDSPAEAILDAARELGCDLIVMASHGRRGVRRLLLGSQTAEVVSNSPVPVLVVR